METANTEQQILKFKLPLIADLDFINAICFIGYEKTDNKFSIEFNGSKGYLDNVIISCEGKQIERNNIIFLHDMWTKKGTLRKKIVTIFHSPEKGIRIEI